MMKGQVTKFVFYLAYFCLVISADDSCRFEHSRGVIDLTSVGKKDNTPVFSNIIPSLQPSDYS